MCSSMGVEGVGERESSRNSQHASEHKRYYGLGMDAQGTVGMDALVTACFRGTYALERRKLLWFGHGCTGHRTLSEHERFYGLAMDALDTVRSQDTYVIKVDAWLHLRPHVWLGHGRAGHRMLSEHERYYGLDMDALVTVCSRNTHVIMVWACMRW